MSDTLVRHRLTRREWHALVETGVLGKQRLALRHGEIVEMSPIGPEHASAVMRTTRSMYRILDPGRWFIRVQDPISLADDDEPQPDIVVAIARDDEYRSAHPTPPDLSLVVEVAQSSYREDRASVPDYAAAGIPTLWIVDLNRRRIEVFTDPDPSARVYRSELVFGEEEAVTVDELDFTVRVDEILPPRATTDS